MSNDILEHLVSENQIFFSPFFSLSLFLLFYFNSFVYFLFPFFCFFELGSPLSLIYLSFFFHSFVFIFLLYFFTLLFINFFINFLSLITHIFLKEGGWWNERIQPHFFSIIFFFCLLILLSDAIFAEDKLFFYICYSWNNKSYIVFEPI
jgi:hypothetical protein